MTVAPRDHPGPPAPLPVDDRLNDQSQRAVQDGARQQIDLRHLQDHKQARGIAQDLARQLIKQIAEQLIVAPLTASQSRAYKDSIPQLPVRRIGQVGNLDLDCWLILACTDGQRRFGKRCLLRGILVERRVRTRWAFLSHL